MTGQMHDTVIYQGTKYDVIGMSPQPVLSLSDIGMPKIWSAGTACHRGHVIDYELADSQLVMKNLYLCIWDKLPLKLDDIPKRVQGPDVNGCKPAEFDPEYGEDSWFNNNYIGVNMNVDYTGNILLGSEFQEKYYSHMGFQKAWKFLHVLEMKFDRGKLIDSLDRSKEMERIRGFFIWRWASNWFGLGMNNFDCKFKPKMIQQ